MSPNRSTHALLFCAAFPPCVCAGTLRDDPGDPTRSSIGFVCPHDLDTRLRFRAPAVDAGSPSNENDTRAGEPAYPTTITFETGFRPAPPRPADVSALSAQAPLPFLVAISTPATDPFAFSFSRDTTLLDGGFGNAPSTDDAGASYFESPGERFDRYSLDLEWIPAGAENQVQWLVLSGIHAVRADIRRLDGAQLPIPQARGMVAIPTNGPGLPRRPTAHLQVSPPAPTQPLDPTPGVRGRGPTDPAPPTRRAALNKQITPHRQSRARGKHHAAKHGAAPQAAGMTHWLFDKAP